jgi:hypothetical protein
MWFTPLGKPPIQVYRAGPAATEVPAQPSRLPPGHPEGYLEAFAQLYTDLADQIAARQAGTAAPASSLLVPGVEDGVAGVRFIEAVLESSRRNCGWTSLD